MVSKNDALEYHSSGRKGKIEVIPTKPCQTQHDLSLAYTPGVADPCLEIQKDPEKAYEYTAKGNLVAVVSNGTAVLGLGNIGALAGKPVMEGKGVLFKRFADIDVFDLEINAKTPQEVINFVRMLEPTFGGINLEDIKAPDCFEIEETLKKELNIPVFHDDQHGTAIISAAAMLNALEITGKDISKIKVVFNGAGAAGIACAELYLQFGVKLENVIMCDTKGVIYKGRTDGMNKYKDRFAVNTKLRTLEEAFAGADAFVGVSVKGCVTQKMLRSMNDKPIVFAMANPDPEIAHEEALAARSDIIFATGRSDYPNQVNNVLGFPFIFRGALDVRAKAINMEMKVAASKALAELAKQDVPEAVCRAYDITDLKFGPSYIIPKPFDPRVLLWESPAVAMAAIKTGVARLNIDMDEYKAQLEARFGKSREIVRSIINRARSKPKRIVFPEGENDKILRASQILIDEKIAQPVLIGRKENIMAKAKEHNLSLKGAEIITPGEHKRFDEYVNELHFLRRRQGVTFVEAKYQMKNTNFFGSMMLHMGDADGLVSGITQHYPATIRPALQIVKRRNNLNKVCGLYMIIIKKKVYIFADTTVNIEPTSEDLAEIAILAAEFAKRYEIVPKIAMLSFSNFGSTKHSASEKVKRAVDIVISKRPDILIDGEMQADTAVMPEIMDKTYPFCRIKGGANILIFPDLASGNIAYKLLHRLGGADVIGPILVGMKKPVHVLQRDCEVNDIVNISAIAVVDAQALDSGLTAD
ncbi:MAG: NADP-dependent malic enzyme [Candidatus Schekmanbacteria bacterium]|nr:NADP-dependent malic enzyme [Candidatus Schekmanbacteria bacterium]